MIEAYVYASCTSCRKTEAVLKDSGVDYHRRDYFRDRFSRTELADILARAGLAPSDILSRRSNVFRAREEEIEALSGEELLALMVEEPTLLRRPLVLGPTGAIVGHHPVKLDAMIAVSKGG